MNTHGLVYRDEHDASLHNLAATDMQLPRLAQLAERLGYHSLRSLRDGAPDRLEPPGQRVG